jgi:hypothetical protein
VRQAWRGADLRRSDDRFPRLARRRPGHYGVNPDLSTFGKIIGGGMPVGCFGGKREIMGASPRWARSTRPAPCRVTRWHGRRPDHPALISRPGFHAELTDYTSRLLDGLQQRADAAGIPFVTTQAGAMFGLYFSGADDIVTFDDVMASDAERFKRFFHLMLEGGVYLAPSAFEAGFTSIAHGDKELQITLDAAERAFAALKYRLCCPSPAPRHFQSPLFPAHLRRGRYRQKCGIYFPASRKRVKLCKVGAAYPIMWPPRLAAALQR